MPDYERFLPLTHLSLAVLLALADGDRHGYAILKEVERLSDGRVRAGTGTLYAALQRMTEEGLIEEQPAPEGEACEDARRRYYGVTELGRSVARAELRRLAQLVELGAARKLAPGGAGGRRVR